MNDSELLEAWYLISAHAERILQSDDEEIIWRAERIIELARIRQAKREKKAA